jgi:hypothetical protein
MALVISGACGDIATGDEGGSLRAGRKPRAAESANPGEGRGACERATRGYRVANRRETKLCGRHPIADEFGDPEDNGISGF